MKYLKTILSSIFILAHALPTLAHNLSYQPPERPAQQQTETSVTRGCQQNLPKLQILAPEDHVALTGQRQTFLLNMSHKPPSSLRISIHQPYVPQALWKDELEVEAAGILPITVPPSLNLRSNQDYILTVAISCPPEEIDSSSYVRVVFQSVAHLKLEKEMETTEQVSYLLNRGIFYDALFLSYQNKLPEFQEILKLVGISWK